MELKDLIRGLIEESILIEETKKERFILKNKNITPEQQQQLIDHLNKYPHKENMFGDWQKFDKMSWADIDKIIKTDSKTLIKKNVKSKGISGLKKDDYVAIDKIEYDGTIDIKSLNKQCTYQSNGKEKLQGIYIPLNWEASKLIASKYVGGTEGAWCTAWQKEDRFWKQYIFGKKCILWYVVYDETKYAVLIKPDNSYEIFDQFDKPQPVGATKCNLPGIEIEANIRRFNKLNNQARQYFEENAPENTTGIEIGDWITTWVENEEVSGLVTGIIGDTVTFRYTTYRYYDSDDMVTHLNGEEYTPLGEREETRWIYEDEEIIVNYDGNEYNSVVTGIWNYENPGSVEVTIMDYATWIPFTDVISIDDEPVVFPTRDSFINDDDDYAEISFTFDDNTYTAKVEEIDDDIVLVTFDVVNIDIDEDDIIKFYDGDDYIKFSDRETYENIGSYDTVTIDGMDWNVDGRVNDSYYEHTGFREDLAMELSGKFESEADIENISVEN
jgi:hypothetical protein